MAGVSRRGFLAGMGMAGVAAIGGRVLPASAPSNRHKGSDLVTLGRSGLKTTVLGIGTGTNGGRQQLKLGQNGFTALVRHALDRGIRYIDTADMYSTHLFVRFALEGVPRDKYFIQTKTRALHPEVAKADIDRFRRELKVDRIDSLLMHCMTKATWATDMRPVMDVLEEAKHKGRVGAVGVSCHGWEPLAAPACPWIDVQLARINPFGAVMDGKPADVAAVLKKLHDSGRGVLGMKIYAETGLGSREKRLESLKYVLNLGCVDAFTIGFVSPDQIDETLELIEQA